MRKCLRKLPIYVVSGALSLTMFATELAAAPRMPRDGDPGEWVRAISRLVRVILDVLIPVKG